MTYYVSTAEEVIALCVQKSKEILVKIEGNLGSCAWKCEIYINEMLEFCQEQIEVIERG